MISTLKLRYLFISKIKIKQINRITNLYLLLLGWQIPTIRDGLWLDDEQQHPIINNKRREHLL